EVVDDDDDIGVGLADQWHELLGGQDHLGVVGDGCDGAGVCGRHLRLDAESGEHPLCVDLEDAGAAQTSPADGDDLHDAVFMMMCAAQSPMPRMSKTCAGLVADWSAATAP